MTDLDDVTFVADTGDGKTTESMQRDDRPSEVLLTISDAINDSPWWSSPEERTLVLSTMVRDGRLSAAHCDASPEAEQRRAEMCAHWALSVAAPMALDAAAKRLRERYPESAEVLSEHATKLRAEPTAENARHAADDAHAANAALAPSYASFSAAIDRASLSETLFVVAFGILSAEAAARAAADAAFFAGCAARSAHSVGADTKHELIKLFSVLQDVRGGSDAHV